VHQSSETCNGISYSLNVCANYTYDPTHINPLKPTAAIWVQLLSVRVPWCQKLQMTA